jgi:hypothetical protein
MMNDLTLVGTFLSIQEILRVSTVGSGSREDMMMSLLSRWYAKRHPGVPVWLDFLNNGTPILNVDDDTDLDYVVRWLVAWRHTHGVGKITDTGEITEVLDDSC